MQVSKGKHHFSTIKACSAFGEAHGVSGHLTIQMVVEIYNFFEWIFDIVLVNNDLLRSQTPLQNKVGPGFETNR
jgi:hypothetical protein